MQTSEWQRSSGHSSATRSSATQSSGSRTSSGREPVGPSREEVRVGRAPQRASYDAASVNAILDSGFVAHVGTVRSGVPFVIPMFYFRRGDELVLHGAAPAGTFRRAVSTEAGTPDGGTTDGGTTDGGTTDGGAVSLCVTVTHVDGLVLARSAFHHSINYRSVVVMGEARSITDLAERRTVLDSMVDVLVPGRSRDLRPMTDKEVRGTSVMALPLATASAKVREGPPIDDEEDYDLPIWAGVLPLRTTYGEVVSDERLHGEVRVPEGVAGLVGGQL